MWDLRSERVVHEIDALSVGGCFSADGRLLLACDGPTLAAYEVDTWQERYRVIDIGRAERAEVPRLSPDGRTVALAGIYDIRLYDVETGERLATLMPPERLGVTAHYYSPDGAKLYALMYDQVIHVWDLAGLHKAGRLESKLGLTPRHG